MFLLKILCRLWDFGKCVLINWINIFAAFTDTALFNGGLNQTMFPGLFFVFLSLIFGIFKFNFRFNFCSNPMYCLINPSTSNLEKWVSNLSKKINSDIIEKLQFNQWHKSNTVLKWFSNITDKRNCSFIQFDIKEYYLSITKSILHQTVKIYKTTYKQWQEWPTHYKPLTQAVTIFW